MTTQLSDRVIIVGGGLAGLALAQGLQKADPPIPFHIFERDTSATYRAQGYRIRIWGDGADALKHLLPEHLWTAFEATCAQLADGARKLDALTNEVGEMTIPRGALPSGTPYNADRTTLRSVLLAGLEDKISFGKVFEGYEVEENTGVVSVQFADGTVEKGRILVGADGVRSVVRKYFLPELKPLDSEGRAIFGKTYLDKTSVLEQVSSHLTSGGIVITSGEQGKQLKLFSEAIYFNRGLEATAGFDLPPDYIYWVICLRSDLVADGRLEERNFLNLDSTKSAKLAGDLTADWNEKVRSVFDNQNPDAASTLSFFICDPENFKSSWENLRRERAREPVVLLGDSAHPMPPVGAVGANTAFQEASDLFDTLVRLYNTSSPPSAGAEEELRNYETRLVDRAIESIRKSTAGAGNFWGMRPLAELKPATVWR
ncbi:hypothetical protein AOL_s00080g374 [Orbilia oligospora ATCC 24927]|uniref:FAD-binding domain-containing protein n=1 Tax=Arthrobotrys oligospora (strain ATCC 24927 / CBS 115.81 / DSM 1491) TaxID=756982 RepID=G1XEY9_ARTOA|nr:hypothetical protein AOL_s00080g374 [Orbilia oligospora ATCC 24927]EGX48249.1 hypothetical protein AOL_s00080g374 [Orbilia oligospora ATCC 24927]